MDTRASVALPKEAKNERLWLKTNLKLGKLWFDREEYNRLQKILKELHKSCQQEDGSDDLKMGTQLLEVCMWCGVRIPYAWACRSGPAFDIYVFPARAIDALEIQMYTATKNNKKLKSLYQKALQIKSAIPHPKIMGVIRECGGKMHMHQREWEKARNDFFEVCYGSGSKGWRS